MNTEPLFQKINSVNQVSIYAAVAKWCYKFASKEEEKEHIPRTMAVVEPEEVDMLISSPNLAQGNLMMQNEAKIRVLEEKVHMTQLCEKALIQYLVTARNCNQRIYLFSRVFPQAKPLGAFPAGTIIGPISEVHIVKILVEHGVEIAIPSIGKPGDVTCVVISRETERFVNGNHTHEAKTKSSRELLENLQECRESKISMTKCGYKRSLKAAPRKGLSTVKTKMEFLCYLRAIQGHSGGIPIEPELMGYDKNDPNWKTYKNHRGLPWNFQSIPGGGLITGGTEKDKAGQAVFLTPTKPFGDDPEEEEPHDDFTVPQKASYVTKWKYDQNAVYWVRLSKALQTKSIAIMTYATIPGDCIDHVTSRTS